MKIMRVLDAISKMDLFPIGKILIIVVKGPYLERISLKMKIH